nr:putative RNA-directed DNA polymerase [Tanacetum cinerariifolium]
ISDWEGIDRITTPPHANYTYSILAGMNAGIDMFMIPMNYTEFIDGLTYLVKNKFLPMSRLDDAVQRILRVKFTMGLFENPLSDYSMAKYLGCQKKAMDDEMKALKKNKTWDQCALPQRKKPVGCQWIFTVKYKPDGIVERYKARLVAKGHTQNYGIDYSETFSPVAKMDTIRVLLSVASNQIWPLHQFDVKNAFLHGQLKEEVYMEAPTGFSEHFKIGKACQLKKSLYGLKQSPRAWFGRFTLAMKRYGFKQSNSVHTLFLKNRKNHVTCLIIYVDDMVFLGNDEKEIKRLKGYSSVRKRDIHLSEKVAHMNAALRIVRRSTSGYFSSEGGSTQIMCDNKDAIQILENPVQHDRMKHVEVDRHFIKEKLEAGIIKLPFVKSS